MDTVYVIYLDGQMYKTRSRKTAYLEEKYAKQVITQESKDLAYKIAGDEGKYYYELSNNELKEYIEKVKQRFEIREFIERRI